MIHFKSRVDINTSKLKRKQSSAKEAAQMMLDQEVLKDSNYFIAKETGELERSSLRHSRIGEGHIEWNTPYARRLYYNPQYNFSKDVNPNAGGLWFESAKALNGAEWLKKVKEKYFRYFNGK